MFHKNRDQNQVKTELGPAFATSGFAKSTPERRGSLLFSIGMEHLNLLCDPATHPLRALELACFLCETECLVAMKSIGFKAPEMVGTREGSLQLLQRLAAQGKSGRISPVQMPVCLSSCSHVCSQCVAMSIRYLKIESEFAYVRVYLQL